MCPGLPGANAGIWGHLHSPTEKAMAPHSSTLAWKIHGQRSLVGCSPWGHQESDTTERLHFHFSLSCIGEGNGNPLQYSCLENPRDGGAWWAAVYGVAQSWTRLKRLSISINITLPRSEALPGDSCFHGRDTSTYYLLKANLQHKRPEG